MLFIVYLDLSGQRTLIKTVHPMTYVLQVLSLLWNKSQYATMVVKTAIADASDRDRERGSSEGGSSG